MTDDVAQCFRAIIEGRMPPEHEHSDVGVTLNTYTHLGLEDAEDELKRVKVLEDARKELDKTKGKKQYHRKCFDNLIGKGKAIKRR